MYERKKKVWRINIEIPLYFAKLKSRE